MATPAGEFDPHAPLVDKETGLEYWTFADFLAGKPVDCRRNDHIWWLLAQYRGESLTRSAFHHGVRSTYHYYSRNLDPYAASANPRLPQGIEHFDPAPGRPG